MKNNYLILRLRIIFLMMKRKKITMKKIFNVLHCYAAYFLKLKKSAVSPYLINFELRNECNERCFFCRTKDGEIYDANPNGQGQYIAKGTMPFEIFRDIISQVRDRLIMIVPYINGEPLLSKDIYKAIQHASDNNIATMIATNGILLNERNCEELLKAGLDFIKIHISGFTQPTHSIEHRKGDVELIKENLRHLVRMNREGGYGMLIMLDYILYQHNKHEIEQVRKFSDELGIMFNVRKGYRKGIEEIEPTSPLEPSMADIPCDWLWTVLTIDWNGVIFPCCDCATWSGAKSYECFLSGHTDILSVWNGPKAIAMRNTHLTNGRTSIPICSSCSRVGVTFKL